MAQKNKPRTRSGKTAQKTVAQMLGKTDAEWAEEIRKEQEEEVQLLATEAKQLPELLNVGSGTPLSDVPKFLYSVHFILDYLLEPSTKIDPTVVDGLSRAIRECAARTSRLVARDAREKLEASATKVEP
jgi:hypothetical protein